MALSIVKCDLLRADITQHADGTSTATQEWKIVTNEPTGPGWATANAHAANADYPVAGQSFTDGYSSTSYLQAASITTRWEDAPKCKTVFLSTVQFVSPGAPSAPLITRDPTVAPTGDPLDEPPVIYFTCAKTKEPFLKDRTGKAVCSSAGEPYNPVQERDRTVFSLHIERNMASDESATNATYKDAVNDDTFWGYDMDEVKVEIPGLVQRLYTPSGQKYFRETWEFSIDTHADGHQLVLHDWGYKKLNDDGEVETIMGANNEYLTAPTFLDLAGQPLDPPYPDENPRDLPVFIRYARMDFDALALPTEM